MAEEANQELQNANGAEATAEGAAASTGGAEAKALDGATQGKSGAADPAGTEGAPAASAEQSREQAADASTDRKDADDEENQPERTVQPPVAGQLPDVSGGSIIVTGPKNGRWRAGRRFESEPVRIAIADLTDDEHAALYADPRLTVAYEPASVPEDEKPPLKAPKLASKRKPARSSKRGR